MVQLTLPYTTGSSQRAHPRFDFLLFFSTLCLVVFGLVMVFSTTGVMSREKFGDTTYFFRRQGVAACVGMVLLYFLSRVSSEKWRNVSAWGLVAAIFLLILPLLPIIGDTAGGARRWVHFPLLRFQPGELAKLVYIIFIAGYLARHERTLEKFSTGVFKPMLLLSPVALLFLLQPDFGSTVVLAMVTVGMGLAAGIRLRYVVFAALGLIAIGALLVVISPYRMGRVMSFLSPWADASGKGYQLIQSLIAVGSGKITGVGLGGSQQKLFFLPAAHTDFIFAVIAEELGFIGAIMLLVLFSVFLWRGLRVARRMTDDTFRFCLAVGLTLLIVIPALLNVGVVTGLLPTKGMVLPFVGYGGSSLIVSLMAVGILLSLAREDSA